MQAQRRSPQRSPSELLKDASASENLQPLSPWSLLETGGGRDQRVESLRELSRQTVKAFPPCAPQNTGRPTGAAARECRPARGLRVQASGASRGQRYQQWFSTPAFRRNRTCKLSGSRLDSRWGKTSEPESRQ